MLSGHQISDTDRQFPEPRLEGGRQVRPPSLVQTSWTTRGTHSPQLDRNTWSRM
jgi:hypothetical protein